MATVVPSVLAVALVVAVVGVLYLVVGNRSSTQAGPSVSSTPTVQTSPATPPATSPPVSTPPATPSAPATTATSPGVSPSESGAATSPPQDGLAGDRPAVVVLNQSGQAGLAGRTADLLRTAGWTVSGTGNFRGTVGTTTVYYPPGQEEAAAALAADLPGTPDRIRPRFSNLSMTRLTVVLTSSYPG